MKQLIASTLAMVVIPATITQTHAGDWAQWRGPNGNNIAPAGERIPVEWSSTKNVLWKVNVPGRGHASPTVVGDLIVLSSAEEPSQRQGVFAFDRRTGKQVWGEVVSTGGFPKIHPKNTHASATTCSDGRLIFATFCHHQTIEAFAFDLSGKLQWKQTVGGFRPRQYEYGYAASPTLYNGTLIVSGDTDTVAWLKALDTKTGRIVWEQERPRKLNWASPIIATVSGKEQLFLSGCEMMAAYDPGSGKPLWSTPCLTMATCGTAVWDEDTVYASGGYPKPETVAVKADGSGRILWRNRVKCYEQSMLLHNGYLYGFSDTGVMYCWEAKTGREMWKERLQGPVSASPLLVGDTIYASNERGVTFVFKANPQRFTPVAKNQLGRESFASPTVADNVLFLRVTEGGRQEVLYAISDQ